MRLPRDTDGIRYAVCESSDMPELIGLVSRTFTVNDPPARAVGLTPIEFQAYLTLVFRSAGTDKLTIVARNPETGEMAGALLAQDSATPEPPGVDRLSPKFIPIMEILGSLDATHTDAPPEPGTMLHLFMLGVTDAYSGRGIGQELVRACLANSARLGYRRAITEATNPTSQHIFRKLGFATRAQVSYADYRRDGVAVFASIADAGGPMSMVLDI